MKHQNQGFSFVEVLFIFGTVIAIVLYMGVYPLGLSDAFAKQIDVQIEEYRPHQPSMTVNIVNKSHRMIENITIQCEGETASGQVWYGDKTLFRSLEPNHSLSEDITSLKNVDAFFNAFNNTNMAVTGFTFPPKNTDMRVQQFKKISCVPKAFDYGV